MIDDEPYPPYYPPASDLYSIWRINGELQFWNTGHRPVQHPGSKLVAIGTFEKMCALLDELCAQEA